MLEVAHVDRGEEPAIDGFDRLVSLGSEEAADDETVPWQAAERRLLRAAADADVPILGICFGGQSLAVALGGGVRRAAQPEIGWHTIGSRAPELVDDGPWLEWHRDEILPPAGAEILAANGTGVQAWRLGRHVGLQFHPEADARIVGAWIATAREDAPAPDGLAEETARHAAAARTRAFVLFDALLDA